MFSQIFAMPFTKPFRTLLRRRIFIALEHPKESAHQYYHKSHVFIDNYRDFDV